MNPDTSWIGGSAHAPGTFADMFDAAVVMPTVLRPGLARAVRSVFAQDIQGRVQLLIGIDDPKADLTPLRALHDECPPHMALCVLNLGYSSAAKHGGPYSCNTGGALRTILSYMAHSEYVAYLDDDNWFAPNHLSELRQAVEEHDWAFSYRIFANPDTGDPICYDEWESIGPDQGVFKQSFGGFCDPNTMLLNKLKCHKVLPDWSVTPWKDGTGSDRIVFDTLRKNHSYNCSRMATSFYSIRESDSMHSHRLKFFQSKGLAPAVNAEGQTVYMRKALD